MTARGHETRIQSSDFDALVSDVSAAIWNQLIEKPALNGLQPRDFAGLFEAVARTLHPYKGQKLLRAGSRSGR